jgi:MYXO-CTERM domain-containing protein
MKRLHTWAFALVAGVSLFAPAARADVADLEECDTPGEPCSTARVQKGTCNDRAQWSCSEDGKLSKYTSRHCETDEVFAQPADQPLGEKPDCKDTTGCSVRQVGTERGIGALFLVIGLGAFGWSRRRRR